jgi:O-acetylhomoserine (thiol)-lyase
VSRHRHAHARLSLTDTREAPQAGEIVSPAFVVFTPEPPATRTRTSLTDLTEARARGHHDWRPDMSATWSFETKQIHAGQTPDSQTNARALPIYQTTSYTFNSTEHAANLFGLKEFGNIYTRIMNPTQAAVEDRVAALEGGVAALLVSSGQAAETIALLNIAEAGDHIVSSPSLYGGTYNLFHYTFPKLGVEVSFVDDPDDLEQWRAAVRPNTKAFFGETISNPKTDILDIEGVARVAHEAGVPLIVDNTVATPYLIRPIEFGADIVVHSATKYLGGHGTAVAGVIVDSGNFDFAQDPERFPNYNQPDPSYHGLVYARDLGVGSALGANLAFILKARVQLLRDLGSAVSPFNAFLIAQGIETLSLRIERHVENAQKVAEFLEARDEVESVNYAGLPSSPWFERGKKYAPKGTGAVLSFEIKGGLEAGKTFVEALELHSHVANIGDVRSLVIHPASTTHSQLSPEEQLSAGVTPGLVRLAVGIEGIEDILADLDAGFRAAKGA